MHTTRLLTLFYTTGIQLDNIGDSGRFLASMLDSYANM